MKHSAGRNTMYKNHKSQITYKQISVLVQLQKLPMIYVGRQTLGQKTSAV
jgi:hypothetical protein